MARKPGRPTKFTPEAKARIIEGLELGLSRNRACDWANITPSRLSEYIKKPKNAKFRNDIKRAEVACEVDALKRINAGKPGWQSAAWLLERKWPDVWAMKNREPEYELDDPDPKGLA